MDQPIAKFHKSTVANHSIGLNSDKLDDSDINGAVWRYVNKKKMAPIPKGDVGKCSTMRMRILQMSLFPDIYDKRGKSRSPGNVDFGEEHHLKD